MLPAVAECPPHGKYVMCPSRPSAAQALQGRDRRKRRDDGKGGICKSWPNVVVTACIVEGPAQQYQQHYDPNHCRHHDHDHES